MALLLRSHRLCSSAAMVSRGRRALTSQFQPAAIAVSVSVPGVFVDRRRQWFSSGSEGSSSSSSNNKAEEANKGSSQQAQITEEDQPLKILYEGPFANLSLRLKRVSVTTAALGVVGMPILMALHSGDVPATGQLAVGGTAIAAAVGSTIALSFCFSPYVHKLEEVPGSTSPKREIKATTANILGMRVETTFDPATDVGKAKGSRPFCNFTAKGLAMYVHPELVCDEDLRLQLLGADELEKQEEARQAAKKNEDDDFL